MSSTVIAHDASGPPDQQPSAAPSERDCWQCGVEMQLCLTIVVAGESAGH